MDIVTFFSGFHFRNELWTLIIPVALMGADILTGLAHAWGSQNFKSKKMRSGLSKKAGEIMILLIGELFSYGMELPPYIMAGVSAYIILMELASIAENLKKLRAPLPGFVVKALNTVDEALKEEEVAEALKKMSDLEKEIDALKRIENKEP